MQLRPRGEEYGEDCEGEERPFEGTFDYYASEEEEGADERSDVNGSVCAFGFAEVLADEIEVLRLHGSEFAGSSHFFGFGER